MKEDQLPYKGLGKTNLLLLTDDEREAWRNDGEEYVYCSVMKICDIPEPNNLVIVGPKPGVRDVLRSLAMVVEGCQEKVQLHKAG